MYKRMLFSLFLVICMVGVGIVDDKVEEVKRKILEKANIENLQIRVEGESVVLEGRAPLLKDKWEAGKIAKKELKKDVKNDIIVADQQRSDEEITLDVVAKIKRSAPQNYVFDSLSVKTVNGHVILMGKVRNANLYDIAAKAAAEVPGVKSVENQIEILAPSAQDDRLRLAIYRRLRNDDRLFYYFMGAQPSINIIVDRGRVTLQGYVDTEVDRMVAGTLVRQMSGVLSVNNELRVD